RRAEPSNDVALAAALACQRELKSASNLEPGTAGRELFGGRKLLLGQRTRRFSFSAVGSRRNVRLGEMASVLPRPVSVSPRNPVRLRCRNSSVHPWYRWSSRASSAGSAG